MNKIPSSKTAGLRCFHLYHRGPKSGHTDFTAQTDSEAIKILLDLQEVGYSYYLEEKYSVHSYDYLSLPRSFQICSVRTNKKQTFENAREAIEHLRKEGRVIAVSNSSFAVLTPGGYYSLPNEDLLKRSGLPPYFPE